jgi:exonuclease III
VGDDDQNPPFTANKPHNNTPKNNQLYIMTYNVRTLSTYERLMELEEAIKEIKYDVIGISEMRRLGNKVEEYDKFILYHIGQTPGKYGVGFIVNKSIKRYIESFIGLTERVNIKYQYIKLQTIHYTSICTNRLSK